jgi:hypothetical protein
MERINMMEEKQRILGLLSLEIYLIYFGISHYSSVLLRIGGVQIYICYYSVMRLNTLYCVTPTDSMNYKIVISSKANKMLKTV